MRSGRTLRPKSNGKQAHFYIVVSADTPESVFTGPRAWARRRTPAVRRRSQAAFQ